MVKKEKINTEITKKIIYNSWQGMRNRNELTRDERRYGLPGKESRKAEINRQEEEK